MDQKKELTLPKMMWSQFFSDAEIHDCACQWRAYSHTHNKVYVGIYCPYTDVTKYIGGHFKGKQILSPLSSVDYDITTKKDFTDQMEGFYYFINQTRELLLDYIFVECYFPNGEKEFRRIYFSDERLKKYIIPSRCYFGE